MTTIHQETFDFLAALADHNHREWFQDHKSEYERAKENVEGFAASLIKIISQADPAIPAETSPKKSVLRIYRDIRFSKDKTPYKSSFVISINAGSKATDGVGYYMRIRPGACSFAGGYWHPQTDHLKAIRQEIDYNTSEFLSITDSTSFKKFYGGLDRSDSLKTSPKGYDSNHPHVDLLKLRSFIVSAAFSNKELMTPAVSSKLSEGVGLLYPLCRFLRNAIS